MSNINILRAVENIKSGTTAYTPVLELIVNAIQAIRAKKSTGGTVTVKVIRSNQADGLDKIPAVDGFSVTDDGIGFNQKHRDSFDTLYTALKAADGGKGFGRFTCLKYFHNFTVESVFQDGAAPQRRSFSMGTGTTIITNETVSTSLEAETGSVVTISGLKSVKFPDKGLEIIARVLVEKLLPYFIDPSAHCPQIVIRDTSSDDVVILNDYLTQRNRQIIEISVPNCKIVFPCKG